MKRINIPVLKKSLDRTKLHKINKYININKTNSKLRPELKSPDDDICIRKYMYIYLINVTASKKGREDLSHRK